MCATRDIHVVFLSVISVAAITASATVPTKWHGEEHAQEQDHSSQLTAAKQINKEGQS
jgi:hypothetical protein